MSIDFEHLALQPRNLVRAVPGLQKKCPVVT
jgi:hypothetical protein